jgi:GntR family uxuAB operon transcriptional repressor
LVANGLIANLACEGRTVLREGEGRTHAPAENIRARARRQADEVQAILERSIDQGRYRPGERIATERELAEQFGASRNVVRAALAELGRAGKIVRKVGHGTVVQTPPAASVAGGGIAPLNTSPAELLEFRLALEPGLAEAVTLNASDADMRAILDCLDRGDLASGLEEWEEWDRTFHRTLVAASHNRLAIAVYEAVISIRHERPWLNTKANHTDSENWKVYQSEHRRIANALVKRDAHAASIAIRDHLLAVRVKMLGIVPAAASPASLQEP